MTIFKRLEAHSDEELIQVFQNAPNLFYRLSLQHTLRGTEHYKACALAALRGLAEKAGHHFPSKSNGNLGWDAHHVTKRIFEEQSVFDPYADKAFQDEAVKLCCYYVLRYVAPDQLPKDTDYSLDQFASCFSSKGVLYLRKRGCDFYPDDPESKQSDLGNHRLFLEYSNKNGQYIVGDVSCANRLITNKSGKIVPGDSIGLFTDLQQELDNGTYSYFIPGYSEGAYNFTKADLLRLINSDSLVQYDRVEIME